MKKLVILLGFSSLLMFNSLSGLALAANDKNSKADTASADELSLNDEDENESLQDDEDE